MKQFILTKVLSVVILVLVTVGLGLYMAPRLGELLSLETIDWAPFTIREKIPDSVFAEQRRLEEEYETALSDDIIATLEKLTGPGTVHAVVRAPMMLVQKTHYPSPKTEMDTITGHVKRLSVTVLIDGSPIYNKSGRTVYQPRSRLDIKKYTDAVKTVVGFNARRGDRIEIQNAPFVPQKGMIFGISRTVWANGIAFVLLMGLIIGVIFGVLFPMMRLMIRGTPEGASPHKYPLIKKVMILFQKCPEQSLSVIRGWLGAPPVRKNARTYTFAERAGILVLALGPTLGKKVLKDLPDLEKKLLVRIISRLGRLAARDIQETLTRFMRDFYAPAFLKGTPEKAKEMMADSKEMNDDLGVEINSQSPEKNKVLWQDICALSDDKIRTLLKYTDADVMALALMTANTETAEIFARHMAPQVWEDLKNRFEHLQQSDSRRAREIIIQTAQELKLVE